MMIKKTDQDFDYHNFCENGLFYIQTAPNRPIDEGLFS